MIKSVFCLLFAIIMSYKDILKRRAKKSQTGRVLWKFSPFHILQKPLITEKAYKQVEDKNIYTFRVHAQANKQDVKKSLQMIYKVTPISVRLMRVPYKWRAHRKLVRRSFKKAMVTLKAWDKIELAA